MKVNKMLGERMKTVSDDCIIESQKLMTRGGYIKNVSNGIYSLFTPTQRISKKIQNILREEMDRIDGQEVLFPVVMPAALWEESGRYSSIGSEMARFTDRSKNPMVLGMTHEEAAVQLARNTAKSYTQFPFMIYQIQTKFRDEPRARGGLIRVREFTMKDAYSFHTSQEDLERYYDRAYEAYERIFKRAGAKNVVAVKSDSGMMGGSISHEFMLLTAIGEDTLAICEDPECGYRANSEVAQCIVDNSAIELSPLEKIHTPNVKSIDALCSFTKRSPKTMCKAVVYQENLTDKYVVVFIRGDLDVNETKLRNLLGCEVHAAEITAESGIVAGFIGPMGLTKNARVIFDASVKGIENLMCGANETDYHYIGFNIARDLGDTEYVDVAKIASSMRCPCCGKKTIKISNGIEVGNIFQLGTKYTKSMDMTYLDENNQAKNPIMGCYGIGVGRLIASICEESHDQYGPIWPISIAPWQVELCNLRSDDQAITAKAEEIYESLKSAGVEVLYDDRNIRPGAMFADADLFGCPIRIVISPKTYERGVVEVSSRDKTLQTEFEFANVVDEIKALIDKLMEEYRI